jgi:hypothetical protein
MLKAIPNDLNIHPGWFKFKIYEDGQLIGKTLTAKFKFWQYLEIEMVLLGERYTMQIEQRKITEPEGIKLIKDSTCIATASFLRGRLTSFLAIYGQGSFLLKRTIGRHFRILKDNEEVGRVSTGSILQYIFTCDLPNQIPLAVRSFLMQIVLLWWSGGYSALSSAT